MMRILAVAAVAFTAQAIVPLPPRIVPSVEVPAPPAVTIVAPARARADLQSYVTPDDYPPSALRMGEQGTVGIALDLGVNGRVTGCTITRSSGSAALDSATCRLMRSRARFTPARDSTGNPALSRIEDEVSWTLPAGASPGAQPKVKKWGHGVISNSTSSPAVIVNIPMPPPEPIMAIPQDGPGEADLSVWDPRAPDEIQNLGRFKSIPKCRKAKAKLKLQPGAKAYCTVAPKNYPRFHI